MSAIKKIICLLLLFCTHESIAQQWLWTRTAITFGGNPMSSIEGVNLAIDKWGHIYTLNNYSLCSVVLGNDTISGGSNFIIAKYDTAGNLIWAKASKCLYSGGLGLSSDPSGNLIVAGQFQDDTMRLGGHTVVNDNTSTRNYFIYKLDSAGNALWAKSGGATNATTSWPVRTDSSGNVYFLGSYTSDTIHFGTQALVNTTPTAGHRDLFLVKYDPSGNVLWAKNIGGDGEELQTDIAIDRQGDVYISAWFYSNFVVCGNDTLYKLTNNASKASAFVAKYNSSGTEQWATALGGNLNVIPLSLRTDLANNLYVTGNFEGGTLHISGDSMFNAGPGVYDGFLAKYNSANGSLAWSKQLAGDGSEQGFCLMLEPHSGHMWLSGELNATYLTIGSDSILNPYTVNLDNVFITELDTMGNMLCKTTLNGGGDDINFLAFDDAGYMYFSGDYEADPFIVGNDTIAISGGVENMFVSKFKPCILPESVAAISHSGVELQLFPNPAKNQFTIQYGGLPDNNASLSISDINGRLLKTVMLKGNKTSISTNGLQTGMYICKVVLNGNVTAQKLLIE